MDILFRSGNFTLFAAPGFPYFATLVDATDLEPAVVQFSGESQGIAYCIPKKHLSLEEHYAGGPYLLILWVFLRYGSPCRDDPILFLRLSCAPGQKASRA